MHDWPKQCLQHFIFHISKYFSILKTYVIFLNQEIAQFHHTTGTLTSLNFLYIYPTYNNFEKSDYREIKKNVQHFVHENLSN